MWCHTGGIADDILKGCGRDITGCHGDSIGEYGKSRARK